MNSGRNAYLEIPLPDRRLTRQNPPGRSALSYRACTYADTLRRMLARLPLVTLPQADGSASSPLARLNMQTADDWTIGLLNGWAAVTDVLSFYQERIANEGFLRTAIERRSVLELLRALGYEFRPGVAAGTYLTFTVLEDDENPDRRVLVPAGTAVQSVPDGDEPPQVFETGEDFTARAAWNRMRLTLRGSLAEAPPEIDLSAPSMRITGADLGLQPGDQVLLVGSHRGRFVELADVQPDVEGGSTAIAWQEAGAGEQPARIDGGEPGVFSFSRQTTLFPYTPTGVDFRPAEAPAWAPAGIGLPSVPITALRQHPGGTLLAATEQDIFRSTNGGRTWQPFATGPVQKKVYALGIGQAGAVYAGSDDGDVFRSRDAEEGWRMMSGGPPAPPPSLLGKAAAAIPRPGKTIKRLPQAPVRALAEYRDGKETVLIAGTDKGVFRSADQGRSWRSANQYLPKPDKDGESKTAVTDAAVFEQEKSKQDKPVLATAAGVFPIGRKIGHRWILLMAAIVFAMLHYFDIDIPVKLSELLSAFASKVEDPAAEILDSFVATLPHSIKNLIDEESLQSLIESLKSLSAPLADLGSVIAMIYAGIFGFVRTTRFIQRRPSRSLGKPVSAVVVTADGHLIAGTEDGLFRSIEAGDDRDAAFWRRLGGILLKHIAADAARRWEPVHADVNVSSLAVAKDGSILAGSSDGRVLRSDDNGATWQAWDQGLKLKAVETFAATDAGVFAAGTPAEGEAELRWSPWQLHDGEIHLAERAPDIETGTWILLSADDRPAESLLRQVKQVGSVESGDAKQPGKLTTFHVRDIEPLATWDRTRIKAWFGGKALIPRRPVPAFGSSLEINTLVPSLKVGRKVFVRGKQMRLRVRFDAPEAAEMIADNGAAIPLLPGESLTVVAPREKDPRPLNLRVRTDLGVEGFVDGYGLRSETLQQSDGASLHRSDAWVFTLEPAREDDPVVSELATIAAVYHGANTDLRFEAPLSHCFDGDTVSIHANVVHATHGETVPEEVLGSSDGSQAYQQFWLQQTGADRRLTYVGADTVSGIEPALAVTISGVTWHRIPALLDAAAAERVFTLRQDEAGRSIIAFGDGRNGARLPSNREQIAARYRVGMGPQGNVPAGSLTLLTAGPAGIDEVLNPLAATGGTGPESIEQAKPRAGLHVRSFGRIVSLSDYENFARSFGGIGQVHARLFRVGGRPLLHLTIAAADGRTVPAQADPIEKLAAAIDRFRVAAEPAVQIASCRPRFLQVTATLLIEADHAGRHDQIFVETRRRMADRFAWDRRRFGQGVSISEVISLLQSVEGVRAVRVTEHYLKGDAASRQDSLAAAVTRSVDGEVLPAEMIVFDADRAPSLRLQIKTD